MALLQVIPRVLELFDRANTEQFELMGCYVKKLDDDLSDIHSLDEFVSVSIQARSDDLCLELYLSFPGALLRETMPTVEAQNSDIIQFQEDWCMELANRFLGRLKNKLVYHRCILMMGLPKLYHEGELEPLLNAKIEAGGHKIFNRMLVVDSDLLGAVHNVPVAARLMIDLINPDLELNDSEDEEEEDWFDESELEFL